MRWLWFGIIALVVTMSSAKSDTISLVCEKTFPEITVKLQVSIDTTAKTVQLKYPQLNKTIEYINGFEFKLSEPSDETGQVFVIITDDMVSFGVKGMAKAEIDRRTEVLKMQDGDESLYWECSSRF